MKSWEEMLQHGDMTKALVACQVHGVNTEDQYGCYALEMAMEMSHFDVAFKLLQMGADPHLIVDEDGNKVALNIASARGHLDMVQLLVEKYSIDVNENVDCETAEPALAKAADEGHIEVVQYLLKAGAANAVVGDDGATISFFAGLRHPHIQKIIEDYTNNCQLVQV